MYHTNILIGPTYTVLKLPKPATLLVYNFVHILIIQFAPHVSNVLQSTAHDISKHGILNTKML